MNNSIVKNRKIIFYLCIIFYLVTNSIFLRFLNVMPETPPLDWIFIYLANIYLLIAFGIAIINKLGREIIYFSTAVYFNYIYIIFITLTTHEFSINNLLFFMLLQLFFCYFLFDLLINIITQFIVNKRFYRITFLILSLVLILSSFFEDIVFTYSIIFVFSIVLFFPTIFLSVNCKFIKKYVPHLNKYMAFIIFSNVVFFIFSNFILKENQNYDVFTFLNILLILAIHIMVKSLNIRIPKYLIKNNIIKIFYKDIPILFFTTFIMEIHNVNIFKAIYTVLTLLLSLKMIDFYSLLLKNDYFKFKEDISKKMRQFELEEIHNYRVGEYIHDEILQDVILLNMNIQENNMNKKNIENKLTELITNIRSGIDLYQPKISNKRTLSSNYHNLIKTLQTRSKRDGILIDFICDDKFFIPKPYNLTIYRIIHELTINTLKHSQGDYSIINLFVKKNVIFLSMINYDDSFDLENIEAEYGNGLNFIKREAERLSGNLTILTKNKSENSISIEFSIKIPIEEDTIYENFIN